MKEKLTLYNKYCCEARVEIGLPDSERLMVIVEDTYLGGRCCAAAIDPGAIPEIIDYLQRAWTEYKRKPPTEEVG